LANMLADVVQGYCCCVMKPCICSCSRTRLSIHAIAHIFTH